MTVAAPDRPKVTLAFLSRAGGYATNGSKLFRVLAVRAHEVLVEDAERDVFACAEWWPRGKVLELRIVRWPPGVD